MPCKIFLKDIKEKINLYKRIISEDKSLNKPSIEFYIQYYGEDKVDEIGIEEKEFWEKFPKSYTLSNEYKGKMIIVEIRLITEDLEGEINIEKVESYELYK